MILPSKKSRIQRQTEESQVPNNKRKYHYYVCRTSASSTRSPPPSASWRQATIRCTTLSARASSPASVCGELAETEAVKHAIAWVVKNHAKDVRILYDYTGLRPPDKENWKSTNQILTDYREFLERVSVLTTIDFERVPGHSGIKGNVIADKVSRRALNRGLHELQKANENRN